MPDTFFQEVKSLVCEVLEIDESELEDTTLFVDDLNIDSILIIEMKTRFEEKYSIKIDKEELPNLNSLNDVMAYLKSRDIQPVSST